MTYIENIFLCMVSPLLVCQGVHGLVAIQYAL